MTVYNFNGTIEQARTAGSGYGEGDPGWSWATNDTYTSGAGDESMFATIEYVQSGVCVKGYDVWIDGEHVCKADGTVIHK
jgi:hypothetical protein